MAITQARRSVSSLCVNMRIAYGSAVPAEVDLQLPLPRLLRLLLQNRALLFVGCSLNQDRTVKILHQVTVEYPELAHYAIVELPAGEPEILQRDRFLSDHGIRPLWYPTGKHECVGVILEKAQLRGRTPGSGDHTIPKNRRYDRESESAHWLTAGLPPQAVLEIIYVWQGLKNFALRRTAVFLRNTVGRSQNH